MKIRPGTKDSTPTRKNNDSMGIGQVSDGDVVEWGTNVNGSGYHGEGGNWCAWNGVDMRGHGDANDVGAGKGKGQRPMWCAGG
eukprot:4801108-Pyramimonas_sp.AAC.1